MTVIESKLKAKNANSGQLFPPGWVETAVHPLSFFISTLCQPCSYCLYDDKTLFWFASTPSILVRCLIHCFTCFYIFVGGS